MCVYYTCAGAQAIVAPWPVVVKLYRLDIITLFLSPGARLLSLSLALFLSPEEDRIARYKQFKEFQKRIMVTSSFFGPGRESSTSV
eukprot:4202718-Pyramimonas_sp.AAC.1